MKPIDLKPFCSVDETRFLLIQPFTVGAFTYATDGRRAIRVPGRIDPGPDAKLDIDAMNQYSGFARTIIELVTAPDDAKFIPMPKLPELTMRPCTDCEGIAATDSFVCEECDGTGNIPDCNPIDIGPARFNAWILAPFAALPDCEICVTTDKDAAQIRFTGGQGCAMPMLK